MVSDILVVGALRSKLLLPELSHVRSESVLHLLLLLLLVVGTHGTHGLRHEHARHERLLLLSRRLYIHWLRLGGEGAAGLAVELDGLLEVA